MPQPNADIPQIVGRRITPDDARFCVGAIKTIIPEMAEDGSNSALITELTDEAEQQKIQFERWINAAYTTASQIVGYSILKQQSKQMIRLGYSFYLCQSDRIEITDGATSLVSTRITSPHDNTISHDITSKVYFEKDPKIRCSYIGAINDISITEQVPLRLTIEYNVGFADEDIPDAINSVVLMMVTQMHDFRSNTSPFSVNSVPIRMKTILYPFKRF